MFGTVVSGAKACFQRRMVVTDDKTEAVRWAISLGSGTQVGWDEIGIHGFRFLPFSDSADILGKTIDNLFLDLTQSFTANDIGRLVSAVRGGGVIIALVPKFENWVAAVLSHHKHLANPPFTVNDARHLFVQRLIRKFYEHEGIWIYRNGKWEKESRDESEAFARKPVKKQGGVFDLCLTGDQVSAVSSLLKQEGVSVLTADRGRGKSAALGLFIAALRQIRDRKTEVIVTAPSRGNAEAVFEFLENGLKALGIPYGYKEGILIGKQIKVMFEEPERACEKSADLFIVDEASGIPLPSLRSLSKLGRVVFSATIHGYEGAGRTFSLRFLKELKDFNAVSMEEPIRYASGDLIEKWLFDTLLLDAEPEKCELAGMEISVPEMRSFFSDEKTLRSFFGCVVSAHYKNTPNDLMILADAPHHFVQLTLSKGAVVGGIQGAWEGSLTKAEADELFGAEHQEGNLIPDIFSKHYGLKEFARLKGIRIIRIVAHPDFQGKGIGSFSLSEIAKTQCDWIGASFGASPQLVNFWMKNGFVPFSISPVRNKVSGEYSLAVVRPVSEKSKGFCDRVSEQFVSRFLHSLPDSYRDIEPDVARQILLSCPRPGKLPMDDMQRRRLEMFLEGRHAYELDVDVVFRLVCHYFESGGKLLSPAEENVLVSKVLQALDWKTVKERTGVEEVFDSVRESVKKVYASLKLP